MKILKSFLFLLIVLLLAYFIFWMVKAEQNDSFVQSDTLQYESIMQQSKAEISEQEPLKDSIEVIKSFYLDFEGQIIPTGKDVKVAILQDGQLLFEKIIPQVSMGNIISSDLNGNSFPEFWITLQSGKKYLFYAFEYKNRKIKELRFPKLMGRQSFGFAGKDTLYIDKSYLVRKFDFKNDTFSDLLNGKRACFYTFGIDDSFTLQRTLDYEK